MNGPRIYPSLADAGVHWFWWVFWAAVFFPALYFVWRRDRELRAEAEARFFALLRARDDDDVEDD